MGVSTLSDILMNRWVKSHILKIRWVKSHMLMSRVSYMKESCHTYEWVMAHVWMSHVTVTSSWGRFHSGSSWEWVYKHLLTWMSHGTRMNESCDRNIWLTSLSWVMSHVWMSHGTRMNESWHTYEWVMAHVWMSHVMGACSCWGHFHSVSGFTNTRWHVTFWEQHSENNILRTTFWEQHSENDANVVISHI